MNKPTKWADQFAGRSELEVGAKWKPAYFWGRPVNAIAHMISPGSLITKALIPHKQAAVIGTEMMKTQLCSLPEVAIFEKEEQHTCQNSAAATQQQAARKRIGRS